ncbi:MAG: AsmA family protein, partial [Deltaproteobacteria bacterium]|nr:AsmA family protein [Deltaproteobacteria bacterium]
MIKRFLFIIPGFVVLCAIGFAAALLRLDAEGMRDRASAAVSGVTGSPLIMQDAPQISLMPLGLKFGAASWGVAPEGDDQAGGVSATVKGGQIVVQLLPLFTGKVLVDEVRLDGADVQIRPKKDAKGRPFKTSGPRTTSEPFSLPEAEVNRLLLTNASLSWESSSGKAVRLSNLGMELDNLKLGAETRLALSADLAASASMPAGAIALNARARMQAQKCELRDVALRFTPGTVGVPSAMGAIDLTLQANYDFPSGRLNLAQLSLAAQGSRAELSGDADVKTQAFNGNFKVDASPRKLIQALNLDLPFKRGLEIFRLQSSVVMAGGMLNLFTIQGVLDSTGISGKLSLDLNRMRVVGNMNLGALNLDALMASVPGSSVPLLDALSALIAPAQALAATDAPARTVPPNAQQSAATPPNAQNAPPAANNSLPSVDMDFACASLTVSKLQFKDIRAKVRGQGLYRVEPLTLNLGTGGTANLKLSLDANAMRCTVAGKVSYVAVGPLLQVVRGRRLVDGTATLDLDNIVCAGTAPKDIRASLSGKGLLTVRGIVLNDVSILPLDAPAGLGKPPTHFEQLSAPFSASGGIVNLTPVTLSSPSANVKGHGVVRLPQENMDFTADVSLLKTTIPVQVSGHFNSISYGLDGKRPLRLP